MHDCGIGVCSCSGLSLECLKTYKNWWHSMVCSYRWTILKIPILVKCNNTGVLAPHIWHTFDINVWNVYNHVDEELTSTNNSVEGWNRKIKMAIAGQHPNFSCFHAVLIWEQGLNNAVLDQLISGQVVQQTKRKYKDCNTWIGNKVHTNWDWTTPTWEE